MLRPEESVTVTFMRAFSTELAPISCKHEKSVVSCPARSGNDVTPEKLMRAVSIFGRTKRTPMMDFVPCHVSVPVTRYTGYCASLIVTDTGTEAPAGTVTEAVFCSIMFSFDDVSQCAMVQETLAVWDWFVVFFTFVEIVAAFSIDTSGGNSAK